MADYLLRAIDGLLLLGNSDDNIESECITVMITKILEWFWPKMILPAGV